VREDSRWKKNRAAGRELDHQVAVPQNEVATLFVVERTKGSYSAPAKRQVGKILMLEADRSWAQVVSSGGKYAGGKNALEGGVVTVQLAETLGRVCVEFRCPVYNRR